MSKVQYVNHKIMKALYIESLGLGQLFQRGSNSGELLLRDCIKERGKNQSKTIVKSYHADFTFDEISDRSESEIPTTGGNFIIGCKQAEAMRINATFSTPYARDQWLESAFKLIEENET